MKTMTTAKVSQRKMIQRLVRFSAQVDEQFESFLTAVGVEPAQLTNDDWSEIEEGEDRIARRFGFINAAIARRAAVQLRLSQRSAISRNLPTVEAVRANFPAEAGNEEARTAFVFQASDHSQPSIQADSVIHDTLSADSGEHA